MREKSHPLKSIRKCDMERAQWMGLAREEGRSRQTEVWALLRADSSGSTTEEETGIFQRTLGG